MSEQYKMPLVKIGQIVLYAYVDNSGSKAPAIVTEINDNSINVCVFEQGRSLARSGVRHKTDPNLVKMLVNDTSEGCWDYTPEAVDLIHTKARIAVLEAAVEQLKAKRS